MTELDYPQHWEADVVLADGGVAHVRPATRADADQIRAMHGRTSARSLYLRDFSVGAMSKTRSMTPESYSRCTV